MIVLIAAACMSSVTSQFKKELGNQPMSYLVPSRVVILPWQQTIFTGVVFTKVRTIFSINQHNLSTVTTQTGFDSTDKTMNIIIKMMLVLALKILSQRTAKFSAFSALI